MSRSASRTTFLCLASLCLMASADLHAANNALLRISCDESDSGAEVYINGQFKGECSLDAEVAAGNVELRVVQNVGNNHERIFEQTFRLTSGTAKRVDVKLSEATLNPEEVKRLQQQAEQSAKAAKAVQAAQEANALNQGPQGMYELGKRYRFGQDLQIDYREAERWLKKAADAGHSQAMADLGYMYSTSAGVALDWPLAQTLINRAADLGNASGLGLRASHNILNGEPYGVPAYFKKWRDAANAGDPYSQLMMYYYATTAKKAGVSEAQAKEFYNQAKDGFQRLAVEGDVVAMWALGDQFISNFNENLEPQATSVYQKAMAQSIREADAGSAQALIFIGLAYAQGKGVESNISEAIAWFEKAKAAGHHAADSLIDQMRSR